MDCGNCGREYPYYYDKCPYCGTINIDTKNAQQTREYSNDYRDNNRQDYYVQQNNPQYNRNQYNEGYRQPVYNGYYRSDEPVSIGSWIGVWLLTCIPIVGFIMLIVWACGGTRKTSLKNWARAQFIIFLILILIGVIFSLIMYSTGYNFNNLFIIRSF